MKLTYETFKNMIKSIRAIYGPTWRSDLVEDKEAEIQYFQNCQELIADELADTYVKVYRTRRSKPPISPYDLLEVNIEKQLETSKPSEFIIEKLTAAIRDYEYGDSEGRFSDCDEYLLQNVIPMLPCSNGVKVFYIRNKHQLKHLALHSPDIDEQTSIYKNLGFDYREQLTITERRNLISRINYTALPTGNNNKQLEA